MAFKDSSGRPVDTRVQQDAQSFLLALLDKLEKCFKGTPKAKLLEQQLGGTILYQLECQGGCNTVRERQEAFNCVSLEVKNIKDLYASFENYVKRDSVSGYYCDKCDKKVTQLKRVCLRSLPRTLLVQCSRFVFDFDSMMNVKLNTRCVCAMPAGLPPPQPYLCGSWANGRGSGLSSRAA